MEIKHASLPPQEYVVHNERLYRIQWDIPPVDPNCQCFSEPVPPRLLIEKDARMFWVTHVGTIFSTNQEKRDIEIISLAEFYKKTQSWNIPMTQFSLITPSL